MPNNRCPADAPGCLWHKDQASAQMPNRCPTDAQQQMPNRCPWLPVAQGPSQCTDAQQMPNRCPTTDAQQMPLAACGTRTKPGASVGHLLLGICWASVGHLLLGICWA